ncbi:MAG TPA: cupredoxin domain-containing protein [Candidatus Limnocylindria bacterium]|nr:cupredoxin domain-containing protein [Candidatus Limnocylindria bacterium]
MKPIRLSLVAVALAAVLAACGSTSAGEGGGSDTPPADADYTVTAVDLAFDPGTLSVAGGEAFTIALVNEDAMPHNIAIYTDESKSEKLFEGELVTDGTIVYDIPALDAGEYFFDCSLHPTMTGTLVVEG